MYDPPVLFQQDSPCLRPRTKWTIPRDARTESVNTRAPTAHRGATGHRVLFVAVISALFAEACATALRTKDVCAVLDQSRPSGVKKEHTHAYSKRTTTLQLREDRPSSVLVLLSRSNEAARITLASPFFFSVLRQTNGSLHSEPNGSYGLLTPPPEGRSLGICPRDLRENLLRMSGFLHHEWWDVLFDVLSASWLPSRHS